MIFGIYRYFVLKKTIFYLAVVMIMRPILPMLWMTWLDNDDDDIAEH